VAPELIAKVPRLKFVFLGNGALREDFENQIRNKGLNEHFRFPGLVPPSHVCHYVAASDFLIHLSRREGLARALPQSLAGGKPVISYDCDGASEVCLDGETGYLVPVDDLDLLKNRIYSLVHDEDLRLRMGIAGRQLVKEQFSVEKMVNDLKYLYQKLALTKE
jgi:glycosyltransferase involved in cell wall biosynthesis